MTWHPERDEQGNVIQRIEYASCYCLQGDAISATVTSGTQNIDFKIQNHTGESYTNKFIWGAEYYVTNSNNGDYCAFQIVDVDNILGYGAGFVVKHYIRKHFAIKHEKNCRKNPENISPCFECDYLIKKELYIYFQNYDYEEKIYKDILFCEKHKKGVCPRWSNSDLGIETDVLYDKEENEIYNEKMPLKCDDFKAVYLD